MSSVLCAGCGHANAVGARFCAQCGGSLAPRCASCGAELPPDARFCSACGVAVEADPVAFSDGTLKVVSVVFTDLIGSTALQEALDTESVRRVMGRFYEAMSAVVERHGGAIQKFIGDAVVVVFGTPIVREDDALRAVRCAAAMVDAVEVLNDELERAFGVRLQMRTGVNTGELVVNDEGIFVGDTMNTAARLEQAASAGEVLVGEATRRLVRDQVELQELEPLALKGKAQPVRVWQLTSASRDNAAAGKAEVPLVGRGRELERLMHALADAKASGGCRLVTVVGSPGLGKSRLAFEFARALGSEATVVVGHCEPSGEGITFLPVAEVLRAAAGIGETDPVDVLTEKLGALLPADADRDRIVAHAAALLGAGESASPEETFWSVRRLLESLARRQPLVVVLDDVHWGQPMFLDLVEHLVEWVRDGPLLLVALARPELREVREALTSAGRRASDVIELEPLDAGESRELVSGLLGRVELPGSLLNRILETTDGNPLFLGELLRMLVDEGTVRREGDAWVAAGDADTLEVPPTISALLTARIERLRADERSVVERAAVIGQQFYRGAVAELVAPPVRVGIDGHLETLRRKDMVEPEGTYWIDEPVYRFHHVLLRDAAYHLLLKEARAELHERFAGWLATKAGELVGEHEEVIAYHLEQAFDYRRQLGPLDERGRAIGSRAAELLWSAGRRALAREDLAAAANLLQRAHECGAEDAVLWDLGEALLSAGDTASAAAAVEKLLGPRKVVLETQLAVLTGAGSDLARIVAATEELIAADDGVGVAKAHHVTAQVQAQLGHVADVEASLDRALLAARRVADRRRITAVLAAAPRAALWGPSPVVRASGRCLDVVRILRMTPGNRHVEAVALRCQAVLEAMRGRADAARDILAAGRTTLEELGLTLELHELDVHAGIVELLDGRPDAAEALLRPARDGFAGLGVSVSAAQAAALLARALVDQGHDEEAIAETEFAEQRAGGDLKTTITWCGVRAEALARRGAVDEAVALARRAVALAEPTDALADKADANMALARVLFAIGREEEANEVRRSARSLYEAKDHAVGVRWASDQARRPVVGEPTEPVRSPVATRPGPVEPASGRGVLGDQPPEKMFAEHVAQFNRHDLEGDLELIAEDFRYVDHRAISLGSTHGREAHRDTVRSIFEVAPDALTEVEEVIACDDRVMAVRVCYHGHSVDGSGLFELVTAYVVVVEDGLWMSADQYDPGDRRTILARYAELGGTGALEASSERDIAALIDDSEIAGVYTRLAAAFAADDPDAAAANYADDYVRIDHRAVGWPELHGPGEFRADARAAIDSSRDIGYVPQEVLASAPGLIAIRLAARGRLSDGDGNFEVVMGRVARIIDGKFAYEELFEANAESSMLACFAELRALMLLGDRPPERWYAHWVEVFREQDRDAFLALYGDDFVLVDRRSLGWEETHGPEAMLKLAESGWAMAPDMRAVIHEVLACDERAIALRLSFIGTGADGGGQLEIPIGYVTVFDGERPVRGEQFDPDERDGMLTRYGELGGKHPAALGDLPPERFFAEWCWRWAGREVTAIADLYAEDFTSIDHRHVGLEPVNGRDGARGVIESVLATAAEARVEVDEVLACSEREIALTVTRRGMLADGDGDAEVTMGYVAIVEQGRLLRQDRYEHDDRAAMLAHYRELRGLDLLGDQPPERFYASWIDCYAREDLDGLLAVIDGDYAFVDRRALAWEEHRGHDGFRAVIESAWRMWSGGRLAIDEVLACDEHTISVRCTYVGSAADGGGPMELAVGYVATFSETGFVRVEQFEHDATEAMLARYGELGGTRSAHDDRPPKRCYSRSLDAWNRRDREVIVETYAEDVVFIDHRAMPWEDLQGRAAFAELWTAAWSWTHPRVRAVIDEVLACDEHTIALRMSYGGPGGQGIGDFEMSLGHVAIVEAGRIVRLEQYDPEDRQAMLARYAELGGGQGPLGDRPPERVCKEIACRYAARDVDGAARLWSPGLVFSDHRAIGWGESQLASAHPFFRSVFEMFPEIRIEIDAVLACDDRVIAHRCRWYGTGQAGGEFEVEFGVVASMASPDAGQFATLDLFEPNDDEGMLARYGELGEARPPERYYEEFTRRYNAHDFDGVLALVAEDWVMVDHRAIGWEEIRGRDGCRAVLESGPVVVPDVQFGLDEVLACDERVIACRVTYRGHARDGSGEMSFSVGYVGVIEDGVGRSVDQYDPDARDAMLAKYAELTTAASNRLPAVIARSDLAFSRHDREALGATYAPEIVWVDRRGIGGEDYQGREAVLDLAAAVWTIMSPDVGGKTGEVLASDGRAVARLQAYRGTAQDGGGELELLVGQVIVIGDGLIARIEFWDPDDRQAMIERYVELGGGQAQLGDRPPERYIASYLRCYGRHDLDALIALLAPDVVFTDHRKLGWDEIRGQDEARRFHSSVLELSPDFWGEVDEVIACDDRVIALRSTWRGTGGEAGGMHETTLGQVVLVQDGRFLTWDQYDAEDTDPMLARYCELGGHLSPEQLMVEYLRKLERRDIPGLEAMIDPEISVADHRALGGSSGRGAEAARSLVQSALGVTRDLRFEIERIVAQDEHTVACTGAWIGRASEGAGELTVPMAIVVSTRDGHIASIDLYERDDHEAIQERFDILSLAALRPYHRFDRLYNERRLDELPAIYTDDYVMVDRRSMAWEEIQGAQALVDTCRSFLDSAPDLRSVCVVLEEDASGEFVLLRNTFTGQGYTAGGAATGPVELVFIEAGVLRGDKVCRTELFDPADEAVARDRFDELRAERATTARFEQLPDRRPVPVRLYAAMCQAFNDRDLDRAMSLHQPDTVMRDHRQMPWEPTDTVHELAHVWRAVAESVSAARYEPEFHLATDEHACVTLRVEAQPDYGGGPAEVVMAVAVGCRAGLMDRHELYEDPSDALARTGELIGGRRGETVTLIARYLGAYRDRDLGAMGQLWAPHAVLEDHRPAGLGVVEGVDGILRAIRGLVELAADASTHAREFLELRDDAALYRHEVSGHDTTGGAIAVEMLIAAKAVAARFVRAEMFALEDEPAARAHFEAL